MIRAPLAPKWVADGDGAAVDIGLGQIGSSVVGPGQNDGVSLATVYRVLADENGD